ncbi:hypothetical protein [Marispirochaeta sp.]|jgi:DNA-directed RNA polymerase specialized sigma24 family protein|uniref:hypothetical protein n=1 Tax=Marispirochaeta sp. TaxID=2038653 RepID=UPI0029C8D380|nr:hypothetical protein [Marispirochaeta sp.]
MNQNLTPVVLGYQEGRIPRYFVIEKISIFAYNFLRKKHKDKEDTASDIFCEIYRRIPNMIDSFVYRGRPFEIYLHMSIRRATYTYFENLKRQQAITQYSEMIYFDTYSTEPDEALQNADNESPIKEEYREYFSIDNNLKIQLEHLRRRLLCLVCKNAYFASPVHIQKAAHLTGVSYTWLSDTIETLRRSMKPRSKRFSYLSLLRKENMAKAHILQQAEDSCCVHEEQLQYRHRCKRVRSRMDRLIKEMHHVPLSPTHSEIARALRIPKGSVDSGLHYLRTALLNKKDSKQYPK